MNDTKLQLFESQALRSSWDEEAGKWCLSSPHVLAALTSKSDYTKPRNYWNWLKRKLKQKGSEVVSITTQLKSPTPDGKQRLEQLQDHELSFEQAMLNVVSASKALTMMEA